eukprot:5124339-Pyramimonas_sp.AAC.1
MGHQFRSAGLIELWNRHADPGVETVARGVNGPLFERLLADAGFHDPQCVEFFREARLARCELADWEHAPPRGPHRVLPSSGSSSDQGRASKRFIRR